MARTRLLAVLTLILSALDGILTLRHLRHGGTEANPVMAALIAATTAEGFLVVKIGVTCLALALLYGMSARRTVNLMFAVYVLLLLYHLFILVTHA